MTDDLLQKMMDKQRVFQARLGHEFLAGHVKDREYFRINALAIMEEVNEILREVNWKPWKRTKPVNIVKLWEEVADLWHFVLNITMAAGLDTSDSVYLEYTQKNDENHRRQNDGY